MEEPHQEPSVEAAASAWARSGAMALTGPADGPGLGPPAPLVPRLRAVAERLAHRSAQLGTAVAVDPLRLLAERAAAAGLRRQGQVSCGGAARLLRTADGWLAVSLARPDDLELVPAWLGRAVDADDVWAAVADAVAAHPTDDLVAQGRLLGLPVGGLPRAPLASPALPAPLAPLPGRATRLGDHEPAASLHGLVVVDLSALWAGPLAGSLLADAGATVVKVESTTRPDGARHGPPAFFDRLNAGKRCVALDLRTDDGRRALAALVARADVVLEAARPRALAQLGVHAEALVQDGGPRVWASITGHGRTGEAAGAVGFGDDAAVAGGLVAWHGGDPCFCADAVADPSTGLVAAAAVLEALAAGGRWLLDLSLAATAAHLAGPTLPVPDDAPAAEPIPPTPRGVAAALGAHTDEVLAELGVRA